MMRTWKRPVATIVAATLVVEVVLIVSRSGPAVLLIAALCGLVGVVGWFVLDLAEVTGDTSDADFESSGSELVGMTDRRVMRLRSGLAYTRDDASLERLRSTLVDLVDDQLRAVYHINRANDPGGASAVLGPDLSAFVDDPHSASRLDRPSEVDRVLTLIEQI